MPIIKSAKKQVRSSARRRQANLRRQKTMHGALQAARLDASKSSQAFRAIDRAARCGTIHRNKAARLKSRLSRRTVAQLKP